MHSFHLSNFLSAVVNVQKKKKFKFSYTPCSNFLLANIKKLTSLGYFYGYTIDVVTLSKDKIGDTGKMTVTVWLKYYSRSNLPLITSCYFFTSPSSHAYISYKHFFKKYSTAPGLYIFSTSRGIVTSNYCLENKVGGVLLYKVN